MNRNRITVLLTQKTKSSVYTHFINAYKAVGPHKI